jgi:UDP-glucose 4-epimerase
MRILITGGAGFIGSNLLIQLDQAEHTVRILDNFSNGDSGFDHSKTNNVIIGDIRDYNFCEEATRDIDAVIHLAAKGNVADSIKNPDENFQNNVKGTFNILKACEKNGVNKFILASTGGALMGNCELPVNESSVPKPISPYGASKLACEGYCQAFSHIHDININILRFANVYGPYSLNKVGLVNTVMRNISNNKPIVVYGDGSSTRDFIFVDDLCRGIIQALHHNNKGCDVFHLGTGIETSIIELINTIIRTSKKEGVSIKYFDKRLGEVLNNFSSPNKAKEKLNFLPSTNLDLGVQKTWEWHLQTFSTKENI